MNTIRKTIILAAGAACPAIAQDFTFTRIADTATSVPGGAGAFSYFDDASAVISGANVAFLANDANGDHGVYLFDGLALSKVAAAGDPVPGLSGLVFEFFFRASLSGNTIGFPGFSTDGSGNQVSIVLTATGGVLTNRADTVNTSSPSTGTPFQSFGQLAVSGGAVAFSGDARDVNNNVFGGIFTDHSGSLATVLDLSTPVPGLPTYAFDVNGLGIAPVALDGYIGLSTGVRDNAGQYADVVLLATPSGALTNVADTVNTISPSTGSVFERLRDFDIEGEMVAFLGSAADPNDPDEDIVGLYTNLTGPLTVVADSNTPVPGQTGLTFIDFERAISIDAGRIVFEGLFGDDGDGETTGEGLYLFDDGVLSRIVDNSQMLDDKAIDELGLANRGAIDGGSIAFVADFTDGSQAVFTAVINEPIIGDLNCDGVITVADIGGFVLALTNPSAYAAAYPDCNIDHADINDDGGVTVGDIGLFVQLLTGS